MGIVEARGNVFVEVVVDAYGDVVLATSHKVAVGVVEVGVVVTADKEKGVGLLRHDGQGIQRVVGIPRALQEEASRHIAAVGSERGHAVAAADGGKHILCLEHPSVVVEEAFPVGLHLASCVLNGEVQCGGRREAGDALAAETYLPRVRVSVLVGHAKDGSCAYMEKVVRIVDGAPHYAAGEVVALLGCLRKPEAVAPKRSGGEVVGGYVAGIRHTNPSARIEGLGHVGTGVEEQLVGAVRLVYAVVTQHISGAEIVTILAILGESILDGYLITCKAYVYLGIPTGLYPQLGAQPQVGDVYARMKCFRGVDVCTAVYKEAAGELQAEGQGRLSGCKQGENCG